MQRTLIFLLLFTALIAILALQNSGDVEIKLLFWTIKTSMVLLLILTFAFGSIAGILVSLPGWSQRPKKEKPMQEISARPESKHQTEARSKEKTVGDPDFEDVNR